MQFSSSRVYLIFLRFGFPLCRLCTLTSGGTIRFDIGSIDCRIWYWEYSGCLSSGHYHFISWGLISKSMVRFVHFMYGEILFIRLNNVCFGNPSVGDVFLIKSLYQIGMRQG